MTVAAEDLQGSWLLAFEGASDHERFEIKGERVTSNCGASGMLSIDDQVATISLGGGSQIVIAATAAPASGYSATVTENDMSEPALWRRA